MTVPEQGEIDAALAEYNAPARDESPRAKKLQAQKVADAVAYLKAMATDKTNPAPTRAYAQRILDEEISASDLNAPAVESAPALEPDALPELTTAVQSGDTKAALTAIVESKRDNPLEKLVAERLLRARSLPGIQTVSDIPSSGQYRAVDDVVDLKDITPHTVLHEVVHSQVHRLIAAVEGGLLKNAGVERLRALMDHVNKVRPDLAGMYGMKDLSEFASEAMSNPEFQRELAKIPYQRSNAFTMFAKAVLRMLSIAGTTENTALTEALINVEGVMGAGRDMQIAQTGMPVRGALPGAAPVVRTPAGAAAANTLTQLGRQPTTAPSIPQQMGALVASVTHNPQATASSTSSAVAAFGRKMGNKIFSGNFAFNAAVRSAMQAANTPAPAVVGTQLRITDAQVDGSAVLAGLFAKMGNLVYDSTLYKWVAKDATHSLTSVAQIAAKLPAKYGITNEQASSMVNAFFEARRTKQLIVNNQDYALGATLARQAGDAKRAKALQDKIVTDLKDPAWVANALSLANSIPELNDMVTEWNGVRANATTLLVDTGLWTAEEADTMLDAAEYVPFYRVQQLADSAGPKEFISGFRNMPAKEKRLKGSKEEINDIFDNMMRWTQYAVERGVRNHMAIQRADVAEQLGLGKKTDIDSKAPNVVKLWEGGRKVAYELKDPLFMDAFTGLESIALPLLGWAGKAVNVFRQSVVLNPVFSMLQVPQDAFAAMFTSGLDTKYALSIPARAVAEFLGTLVRKDKTQAHRALRTVGAVGVQDVTASVVRMDLELMEGARKQGILTAAMAKGLKSLHHVSMASDNAVRQAVYTAARAQGVSQAEAVEKAFQLINFRNRGTSKSVAMLARVVPFMNAYLAAQHVAYKTISGTGISPTERRAAWTTLATTTAAVMALSVIYSMLTGAEDDEDDIPQYVRDRTFRAFGGLRVPIRSDYFALPKILAEHLYRHITDSGTLDGANTRKALTDTILNSISTPNAMPQVVKPAMEVLVNYDFFQGRPLVPFNQKRGDVSMQYSGSTSEIGKLIGQAGLVSPIAADHLMRGYLGSLGGALMYVSNAIASRADRPRPEMSSWDAVSSIPGMSAVAPKSSASKLKSDFYELKEATDKVAATVSQMETLTPEKVEGYLSEDVIARRYGLSKHVAKIARELTDVRKLITQVTNAPESEVTAGDKRVFIEELRDRERAVLEAIDVMAMREEAQL